jgi:hypothetical protein
VWPVVKEFAAKTGVSKLAPHDMRRYAESRTMPNQCAGWWFGVAPVTLAVTLIRHISD